MSIGIEIHPSADGWEVSSGVLSEPRFFRSGRAAEDEAHALAQRLVSEGHAAELLVILRDGAIGGRIAFG